MGGGSEFWELVGRRCRRSDDKAAEDPECGTPGHVCARIGASDDAEDGGGGCLNGGVRFATPQQVAEFVRGKRLAIDLSCWIVQCEMQSGLVPPELKNTLYLRNIFYRAMRVSSTKFGGALPLFVADPIVGEQDTVLKNSTRLMRARLMAGLAPLSPAELEQLASKVSSKPMRRNAAFIHKSRLCIEMFHLMGMPALEAPGEAEALCAQLTRADLADAVVSPDGDALCFGATCVIKNLSLKDERNVEAEGRSSQAMCLGLAPLPAASHFPTHHAVYGLGSRV
jgi:hypothetical protein